MIRTDLTASFHTCRAALPSMLERGSGSIVNIASRLGQMGIAETAAYSAAKAGLIGLTRSLAREVGPRGVRVNAVAPGVMITDMTEDLVDSEEGKRRLRDMALGRFGRADEVADAVTFLLSDASALFTGPDAQPELRRVHAVSKVIPVRDAVGLLKDGDTLLIGAPGPGHAVPQRFIDELAAIYEAEGRPRDLTTVRIVGIGDFADRGFSQLGLPGLMRRTIGSNIGNEPRLGKLVEDNLLESYSFPQGVLSQLTREIAAGRPGLVTKIGLGTYVDPRQTGGKQNARTTEDLVEVVTLRGEEWLLFHGFPVDVVVIRGTTADEDGNLDDGGRGGPGRDALDGDGRPELRRHRHRPSPPARPRAARCPCATSRSRARSSTTSSSTPTSGRPTSPGTRRTTRAASVAPSPTSRRCPSTCARSSPGARCSSSRPARSATSASGSAS